LTAVETCDRLLSSGRGHCVRGRHQHIVFGGGRGWQATKQHTPPHSTPDLGQITRSSEAAGGPATPPLHHATAYGHTVAAAGMWLWRISGGCPGSSSGCPAVGARARRNSAGAPARAGSARHARKPAQVPP
jgi:hypothetical protein